MKRILWIALAALLVAACGGKKSRPAQSSARPAPRTFRAVTVPSTVPPEERKAYLRDHYWDNFDFRDTTLLAEVDTVAMVRALFAYVANFVAPDDRAAIDTLMRRASASKPMTEYFAMLAERATTNSTFRCSKRWCRVRGSTAGSASRLSTICAWPPRTGSADRPTISAIRRPTG